MNAMIFAAGLGTRLAPLTDTKPKALVEVGGKPLLEHAIDHFVACGATQIVVNVHHFAGQIVDYIERNRNNWPNAEIAISDESDELLDTGGGLAKALALFADREPIVVGNADVLCNAPLAQLLENHKNSHSEATLITRQRNSTRQLLFDDDSRLAGWINKTTGETKAPRPLAGTHESAFCGLHIVEQELIRRMPHERKFAIIDAYLGLAAEHVIREATLPAECFWFDVGTVEKLSAAEAFIANRN